MYLKKQPDVDWIIKRTLNKNNIPEALNKIGVD